MVDLDGVKHYTIEDLTDDNSKHRVCSRTTLWRRIKAKDIYAFKTLNGETLIPCIEIDKFHKKHPAA